MVQVEVVRYSFLPGPRSFASTAGDTILVSPTLACKQDSEPGLVWVKATLFSGDENDFSNAKMLNV